MRAFTLIELLVVVTIIGVLSLIATPSVQNAHVRSQVARTHVDMRTIGFALEAYAADHNGYPTFHFTEPTYEFFIGGIIGPGYYVDKAFTGAVPLTTPVAYLSSCPKDQFFKEGTDGPTERRQFMYVNWRYSRDRGLAITPGYYEAALDSFGEWHLISGGPSRTRKLSPRGMRYAATFYDPTNGSISPGKLYRTQFEKNGGTVGVWL